MPSQEAGSPPVALGGESLPWAITSKSKDADVAAAYIDFITNADAARVLVETDNLPAMETDAAPAGALSKDVFAAWKALNEAEGVTPYIDYATPTFFDDFTGAVQRLLAGRQKPDAFTKDVQSDYAKFADTL
jgi:raffinose/stachyose/melibiose transport system substrate-binding protein